MQFPASDLTSLQAIQEYDAQQQPLQCLSAQNVNTIINIVNDLCREHDRLGFINGFKAGIHLEQELFQQPKQHAALPVPALLRAVIIDETIQRHMKPAQRL